LNLLDIFDLTSWKPYINTKKLILEKLKVLTIKKKNGERIEEHENIVEWDGVFDTFKLINEIVKNRDDIYNKRSKKDGDQRGGAKQLQRNSDSFKKDGGNSQYSSSQSYNQSYNQGYNQGQWSQPMNPPAQIKYSAISQLRKENQDFEQYERVQNSQKDEPRFVVNPKHKLPKPVRAEDLEKNLQGMNSSSSSQLKDQLPFFKSGDNTKKEKSSKVYTSDEVEYELIHKGKQN
jgi:hypothetical protein